jgi:3-hydroxyacyl-[acyl-carrier-protein] dehydratase
LTLLKDDILKRIPHGGECLLIDQAVIVSPASSQAEFNCFGYEPFFDGHYPDEKVLPGHTMIEAMGQTCALLAYELPYYRSLKGYLVTIEKARFKQKLSPPFKTLLEARLEAERNNLLVFRCKATNEQGQVAAEAILMIYYT